MDVNLTAEPIPQAEVCSEEPQDTHAVGMDRQTPSHTTSDATSRHSSAPEEKITQPLTKVPEASKATAEATPALGLIPIPFRKSLAGEVARAKSTRDRIPFNITGNTKTYPFNNQLFLVIERICACGRARMIPDDEARMNAPLIEQLVSGHQKFVHDVHVGVKRKIFLYGPCKCNPRSPSIGEKDICYQAPATNTLDKWAMYTCGHTKPLQEQIKKPLRNGQRPEVAKEPISADMKCVYFFHPCSKECVSRFDVKVGAYEYVQGWFDEACSETVSGSGWMIGF